MQPTQARPHNKVSSMSILATRKHLILCQVFVVVFLDWAHCRCRNMSTCGCDTEFGDSVSVIGLKRLDFISERCWLFSKDSANRIAELRNRLSSDIREIWGCEMNWNTPPPLPCHLLPSSQFEHAHTYTNIPKIRIVCPSTCCATHRLTNQYLRDSDEHIIFLFLFYIFSISTKMPYQQDGHMEWLWNQIKKKMNWKLYRCMQTHAFSITISLCLKCVRLCAGSSFYKC